MHLPEKLDSWLSYQDRPDLYKQQGPGAWFAWTDFGYSDSLLKGALGSSSLNIVHPDSFSQHRISFRTRTKPPPAIA